MLIARTRSIPRLRNVSQSELAHGVFRSDLIPYLRIHSGTIAAITIASLYPIIAQTQSYEVVRNALTSSPASELVLILIRKFTTEKSPSAKPSVPATPFARVSVVAAPTRPQDHAEPIV